MASTFSGSTDIVIERTRRSGARTKYHWPPIALNFWLLIMLIGSATILGVFADFIYVQNRLALGVPWYFTYWVTVASMMVVFILILLYLIAVRQLLPGIVILGAFILFILYLVGMIVISVELWGPTGSVNTNCAVYVTDSNQRGPSTLTLAWLQQHSICQAWLAAWAFELVGVVFLLWLMVMAWQVWRDDY